MVEPRVVRIVKCHTCDQQITTPAVFIGHSWFVLCKCCGSRFLTYPPPIGL